MPLNRKRLLLEPAFHLLVNNRAMPFGLEHWGKDRAIVVNTQTGKHYSTTPLPVKTAEAQMRILEAAIKKEGKK